MSCDSGLSLSFDLPLDYSLHSSYDNDVLAMGHEAGTSNVSPDDSGDNCGSPQSDKKPRIPQCARCQNHGIYVAVKGNLRLAVCVEFICKHLSACSPLVTMLQSIFPVPPSYALESYMYAKAFSLIITSAFIAPTFVIFNFAFTVLLLLWSRRRQPNCSPQQSRQQSSVA